MQIGKVEQENGLICKQMVKWVNAKAAYSFDSINRIKVHKEKLKQMPSCPADKMNALRIRSVCLCKQTNKRL